ncbi:MAG: CBS domain-containing protein [Deltaproteobacteria bacterium]|nr:CBS domain-containing protein [Deltaproteobacteria bacterium]
MYFVSELLQAKEHEVWSIPPDTSVYDSLKLMAEKNVGALLVLDADKLVGVFSERDYARKVILEGKSSKELSVKEIMSTEVVSVNPSQSIDECMALMTNKRIRHLPVLEGNRLVGIISIGDVVKATISEREVTITHLENYIRAS